MSEQSSRELFSMPIYIGQELLGRMLAKLNDKELPPDDVYERPALHSAGGEVVSLGAMASRSAAEPRFYHPEPWEERVLERRQQLVDKIAPVHD